ncbi:MAG TPA: hypothetical protein VGD78_04045, partial [Chthoniobacterales bacterium]
AKPWPGGSSFTQNSDGLTAKGERSLYPEASLTGLDAGGGSCGRTASEELARAWPILGGWLRIRCAPWDGIPRFARASGVNHFRIEYCSHPR